jgi:hypothetical protein
MHLPSRSFAFTFKGGGGGELAAMFHIHVCFNGGEVPVEPVIRLRLFSWW